MRGVLIINYNTMKNTKISLADFKAKANKVEKSDKFDVLTSEQLETIAGGLFGISRWKVSLSHTTTVQGETHSTTVYENTAWGNFWGAGGKDETYD